MGGDTLTSLRFRNESQEGMFLTRGHLGSVAHSLLMAAGYKMSF